MDKQEEVLTEAPKTTSNALYLKMFHNAESIAHAVQYLSLITIK